MTWFWILLLVVVVALYLNQTAGRLDRLHIRVDKARSALEEQLLRRSALASEVATSGLLDPATSLVLAEVALEARSSVPWNHAEAQTGLTRVLQTAFDDDAMVDELRAVPSAAGLFDDLADAAQRVHLAAQFLDDAVRSCVRVRRRLIVRWLRLAGRAPWPVAETFEHAPPAALAVG